MILKRIGPRVALPQPYPHQPTSKDWLWRDADEQTSEMTLLLGFGNTTARLHLPLKSATARRDLLDAGLDSLGAPWPATDRSS